ncbi:MAG: YceI family protein [Candidatus Eisenbacteria bacterium]
MKTLQCRTSVLPQIAAAVVLLAGLPVGMSFGEDMPMNAFQAEAQESMTYTIDSAHSGFRFSVRHIFSPVPGHFSDFAGTLSYNAAQPESSRIELTIQTASIDTGNDRRDQHLRSGDFFDAETHPVITFKSTRIEPAKEKSHYRVHGDLSLRGVTRPVIVEVEVLGFANVPGMGHRGGFLAKTTINRQDFGVKWNKTLDTGGMLLGDDVSIECPIEVVGAEP